MLAVVIMLSDARIVSITMKGRQTKQCTRCGEHLPIEMFYVNKRSLFGRQGMCKKETRVMPTLEQNRRWRDKPSEFISLPRGVAERYIRYVEAKDAPEAIEYYRSRQEVIDTIKQQLG